MAICLKLSNVTKSFNNVRVLNDIDLVVKKNSIVGLAGSSGSGKSTLLRCVQKLEIINSGTIECDSKMGFIFQDFQLFPHMTVLQNLIYAPTVKNKIKDYTTEALEILKNLGIADKINNYPQQLSGGQKQRVALARSLIMQPELLLCDEPTSNLDVATIFDVVHLLTSVKNMGVTMIIASHDLDFLTKIATKIVVLKEGKIVIDIDPKILENPISYLKKYY
ncbi:MAG: ATP-binding cassette domain-containing protein [Coxiellaceae bacterium]|jgi:polar amino acid transport system ATP-binding protein|nr:ATP-binding cassette domain-containing protein [Coxiellaceae bacterium]